MVTLFPMMVALAVAIGSTSTRKNEELFRACAAEQIYMCGDLVCEGDEVPAVRIASSVKAAQFCLEEHPPSEYFFRPDIQDVLLRCTIYDDNSCEDVDRD